MTSAQWSTPVLTHSAQSTYEPEPCINLRVEGISELTNIIAVSPARLFLLTLLTKCLTETLHTRKAAVYPMADPAVPRPLDQGWL